MSPKRRWRPRPFLGASALLHVGAGALVAWRPELLWPAALTLLGDHAAIMGSCLVPRCALVDHNVRRASGSAKRPSVVLSFDDGPDRRTTPRVLDMLDEAGFSASFFCVGERVDSEPRLAREIVRRGHRIENHTYSHSHLFAFYGPGRMRRDIGRAQQTIERVSGRRPRWFRAPAGLRNPWLDPVLHGLDLRLVSWTRRGYDALSRDGAQILRRLRQGLSPGAILLLHDGSSLRESATRVLDVLPGLLESIESAGLGARALGDDAP